MLEIDIKCQKVTKGARAYLGENAISHSCGNSDSKCVDIAHDDGASFACFHPVQGIFRVFTRLRLENDVAVVGMLDSIWAVVAVPNEDCPWDVFGSLAVHG